MKPSELAGAALSKAVNVGIDGLGPWKGSIEVAEECLTASGGDVEDAIRRSIRIHVRYAATSGGVSGAPGFALMPVTIPGGLAALYVTAARMTGTVAYLRGYDLKSEEVRTVVLITLLGSSGAQALKGLGVEIGQKALLAQLKKLPGEILAKINAKVGWRLLTKFGEKGTINLHKLVPLVGAPIGATFDGLACRSIGTYALSHFPALNKPEETSTTTSARTYVETGEGDGRRAVDVHAEGEQVCTITFDVDSDTSRLELTNINTVEAHRRRGHAIHGVRYLFETYSDLHIIASPDGSNSDAGRALIEAIRDEGRDLHYFGCYRDNQECVCGLATTD